MALIEHLEKLRHFYKMTHYNSINEASKKTGFSQAGLSKSLRLLEEELSCKLFKRSREGLSLTKEGMEVKAFSESLFKSSADLEKKLRVLSSTRAPKFLRIGMYDSIAIYFGFELNAYLKQVYPQVKLEITADSSSNLLRSIQEGTIDIAIGVNFHKQNYTNLNFYRLFDDNYSLYFTTKNFIDDSENSMIVYPGATDEYGKPATELFKNELKGKRIHVVSHFETLKEMVASGLGIGILPTLVAKPLLQTGKIAPYEMTPGKKMRGKHSIGVLVRLEVNTSYREFISDIIRLGDRWIKT